MRMKFFDGVRGLMAMIVIVHHFVIVFYPEYYWVEQGHPFAASPWAALVNGNVGVQYFFMLSGFLVIMKYREKVVTVGDVAKAFLKRYLRLVQIVFVGTFLAYILMKTGCMFHLKVASLLPSEKTLLGVNWFIPTLGNAIKVCFIDTFMSGNRYNGPFWTIVWEVKAYVFLTIISFLKNHKALFLKIIYYLALLGYGYYAIEYQETLAASFMGAILAELWLLYSAIERKPILLSWIYKIGAGCVGLLFATIPQKTAGIHYLLYAVPGGTNNIKRAFGIFLLCSVLLISPLLQRIFENKLFLFLGRMSDLLYGIHWPIILSVGCAIYYYTSDEFTYQLSTTLAFVGVVIVTILAAYLFSQFLNRKWKVDFRRLRSR